MVDPDPNQAVGGPSHCVPDWSAGNDEWPVQPEILGAHLQGARQGLASRAEEERWANRTKLVVADCGKIPDERAFLHRYSCWERHPGLCWSRDRDVYDDVLRMAKSMERLFTSALVGHYFVIFDMDEIRDRAAVVYLASRRARRPHSQQVLNFIACSAEPGPDLDKLILDLEPSPTDEKDYRYISVWTLALSLLRAGWAAVYVHKLLCSVVPGTSFVMAVQMGIAVELATEVYPKMHKPVAKAAKEEDPRLEALQDPRPVQRRRPTGGIKASVRVPEFTPRVSAARQPAPPPSREEGPGLYGPCPNGDSEVDEIDLPPDHPAPQDEDDAVVEPILSDDDESHASEEDLGAPEALGGQCVVARSSLPPPPPPPPPPPGSPRGGPEPPEHVARADAEASHPPPPPPPGAHAVARPRTVDRYPRVEHPFTTDCGKFHGLRRVENPGIDWFDMTAYCGFHEGCKRSKTLREGRKHAQGRPIGFLWAWLAVAPLCDSKEEHENFQERREFNCRRDARQDFAARADCASWLEAERKPRTDTGEGDEPEKCP